MPHPANKSGTASGTAKRDAAGRLSFGAERGKQEQNGPGRQCIASYRGLLASSETWAGDFNFCPDAGPRGLRTWKATAEPLLTAWGICITRNSRNLSLSKLAPFSFGGAHLQLARSLARQQELARVFCTLSVGARMSWQNIDFSPRQLLRSADCGVKFEKKISKPHPF